MDQRTRASLAGGAIVGIFLLVQLGALAMVQPFEAAGYRAVENPQNPANSLVYVALILVATALMLLAIHYGVEGIIRAFVVVSGAYLGLYVFRIVLPPLVTVPVAGLRLNGLAWLAAIVMGAALYVHPEWYVIDVAGIVMGIGAAGLFGISFGLLPALLLLVVLAVYDAISVYGTEHMLTLASGVMDLKVPVVLVVPLSLSYSYLDAEMPDPAGDGDGGTDDAAAVDGGASDRPTDGTDTDGNGDSAAQEDPLDREALFIGLGDAVIPAVLVASAAVFAPASVPTVAGVAVPAVTAMVGTVVGLVVLIRMVLKGRAHAGLPLLNGGTIAGYLIGALASGVGLVQALGLDGVL
ncbi:MAG: presenilin family intramembrane aspartyl protease PSH [Haloarculaceae archaeon]